MLGWTCARSVRLGKLVAEGEEVDFGVDLEGRLAFASVVLLCNYH